MNSSVKDSSSLARASAVTKLGDNVYEANLAQAFCIGTVPNGGYVASVFVNVARAHLRPRNQTDTIAAHWQYLGRTQAGRAIFVVEETKLGRSTSVLHISLHQDGLLPQHPWISPGAKHEVAAYITNGNLDAEAGVTLATGWTLDHPPPPVDLAKLSSGKDTNWERLSAPIMQRVPCFNNLEFYTRRTGHAVKTAQDYWIRMSNGETFTPPSLAYVVDSAPAMIIEEFRPPKHNDPTAEGSIPYDQGFWYPTLVMSLDVKKRLPARGEEWLRMRVGAKSIKNGRYDAEILVFDTTGDLVALSHHVALAVDISRNYANRQRSGKL